MRGLDGRLSPSFIPDYEWGMMDKPDSRRSPARCFRVVVAIVAGWVLAPGLVLGQGSLTPPPGAPAPTLKTLGQIEPRSDLQATTSAAGVDTSDADYQLVINQPGSYYLSANLAVTKAHGIKIAASGVTIDLNGFQVSRGAGTGGNGIVLSDAAHGASISKGSIAGFAGGIESDASTKSMSLQDLVITGCTTTAINAGLASTLRSCRVTGSACLTGIAAGKGSIINNCIVVSNSVGTAVNTSDGVTVENCQVSDNSDLSYGIVSNGGVVSNCSVSGNTATFGIGILAAGSAVRGCSVSANSVFNAGIKVIAGSTLTECSVIYNETTTGIEGSRSTLINCNASQNFSLVPFSGGIQVNGGSVVTGCAANENWTADVNGQLNGFGFHVSQSILRSCTARRNDAVGIYLGSECDIRESLCSNNGTTENALADGIYAADGRNRIEGNHLSTNRGAGIKVNGIRNLVVGNTASGNYSTNYTIVAGNRFGPVVDLTAAGVDTVAGNSAAGNTTSSDPTANFAH
jgi:hypothetical protein